MTDLDKLESSSQRKPSTIPKLVQTVGMDEVLEELITYIGDMEAMEKHATRAKPQQYLSDLRHNLEAALLTYRERYNE